MPLMDTVWLVDKLIDNVLDGDCDGAGGVDETVLDTGIAELEPTVGADDMGLGVAVEDGVKDRLPSVVLCFEVSDEVPLDVGVPVDEGVVLPDRVTDCVSEAVSLLLIVPFCDPD